MTAGWCSRTSCARTASARSCSASSRTATPRHWRSSTRSSDALQTIRQAAPAGLEINELFDQSVFVKQALVGVLREGAIAAALTAAMILLFLGSWRSTLVVMISIPLAILSSLVALYFLGETHQHPDAGRPRARGRHPGRRFHGHHREHASPAHRGAHAPAAGDAARRRRHRHPDAGLDARPSAACSPRSSSSTARRSTCSRRSAWPSCSRCSPPMACRGP